MIRRRHHPAPPTPAELWRDYGWLITERVERAIDAADADTVERVCAAVVERLAWTMPFEGGEPRVELWDRLASTAEDVCADLRARGIDPRSLPRRDPAELPPGLQARVAARIRQSRDDAELDDTAGEPTLRGAIARSRLAWRRHVWAVLLLPRRAREALESRLGGLSPSHLSGNGQGLVVVAPAFTEAAAVFTAVASLAGFGPSLPAAPFSLATGSDVTSLSFADHATVDALGSRAATADGEGLRDTEQPVAPDDEPTTVRPSAAGVRPPVVSTETGATKDEPIEEGPHDDGVDRWIATSIGVDIDGDGENEAWTGPTVGWDCRASNERGPASAAGCALIDKSGPAVVEQP